MTLMQDSDRHWRDFYNGVAGSYDWQLRAFTLLLGAWEPNERRKLVGRLAPKPGQRVLEVSVGTGSNLPLVAEGVGAGGRIVGLDISTGMLRQCEKKVRRRGLSADLIEGEAAHLPFADDAFDGVLHFGGINEFGDMQQAIDEMVRVARPDARVVISDEGLPAEKRRSLRSKLLLRFNPLYASEPPMDSIPSQVKDLHLTWYWGNAYYIIDFVNP